MSARWPIIALLSVLAVGVAFTTAVDDARGAAPEILSYVEGREADTHRHVLTLIGRSPFRLLSGELLDDGGNFVGDCDVETGVLATALIALPVELGPEDAGDYTLRLAYTGGTLDLDVRLGFGGTGPAPMTYSHTVIAATHFESITAPTMVNGHSHTFTKKSASSSLRISYTDTFGLVIPNTNESGVAVRLLVDGQDVGIETAMYRNGIAGWLVVPLATRGIASGIAAGEHTVEVQVIPKAGAVQFLAGAYGAKALLEVEEFQP